MITAATGTRGIAGITALGVTGLLVIGDSTSLGAAVIEGDRVVETISPHYVDLLRRHFPAWRIEVDAAPLRRTRDAAAVVAAALERARPTILLLATGSNDVDIDWRRFVISGGAVVRSRTPDREYAESLRAIARAAAARDAALVVTDALPTWLDLRLPFLDRAAGRDVGALVRLAGGQARADEIASAHQARTAELAAEIGAPLVHWGAAMLRHDPRRMIGPDGTHPSAAAHEVLASELVGVLRGAARAACACDTGE